jgi:hypothetical protein
MQYTRRLCLVIPSFIRGYFLESNTFDYYNKLPFKISIYSFGVQNCKTSYGTVEHFEIKKTKYLSKIIFNLKVIYKTFFLFDYYQISSIESFLPFHFLYRKKVFLEYQGDYLTFPSGQFNIFKDFTLRVLARITLKSAYNIRFVSPYLHDTALRFLRVDSNITIYPPYVKLEIQTAKIPPDTSKFICLFIGNKEYSKGLDLLLPHFCNDALNKNFELHCVGVEGENLSKVIFHGFKSRLETLEMINSSHIVLIPSREEGFSRVLIETVMSKIPVLTSDIKVFRSLNFDYWPMVNFERSFNLDFLKKILDDYDIGKFDLFYAQNFSRESISSKHLKWLYHHDIKSGI